MKKTLAVALIALAAMSMLIPIAFKPASDQTKIQLTLVKRPPPGTNPPSIPPSSGTRI